MSGQFLLLRFLSTGGLAAVVNLLSRYELNRILSFEIAVFLAYLVGMLTAYVLARRFVFQASGRSIVSELKRSAIVNVRLFLNGRSASAWPIICFRRSGSYGAPTTSPILSESRLPQSPSYFGH
jgi:putative flippase GtrA